MATADWSYLRYHGASGEYAGTHDDVQLAGEARRITDELLAGRDVYAYFNNDTDAHAVDDATRLRAMVADTIEARAAS